MPAAAWQLWQLTAMRRAAARAVAKSDASAISPAAVRI
jgi:hypothetical protein